MSTSFTSGATTDKRWQQIRLRLTILYMVVALALLIISAAGHLRLLNEVGKVFGGFFWAIDTGGRIVVVSTPPQLPLFEAGAESLTTNSHIVAVNKVTGETGITQVYQRAQPGDPISYTISSNNNVHASITRPATRFTLDMWWQSYGMALLAGISWLLVGAFLVATAREWTSVVEGITLLPPALLFLLYSHWGNVQQPYQADIVVQLLWIPSFALLGAALIHLSLTYRPERLRAERIPGLVTDGIAYLPLIALVAYVWSDYILTGGHVPTRINIILSLGYAAIGALISLGIGINSLLYAAGLLPRNRISKDGTVAEPVPPHICRRIGDLLTLWIGGVGIGFCLGILPILLIGQTLLPLPAFYTLAIIYPLLLLYAIRSLRLVDRLHLTVQQREEALLAQHKNAETLRQANSELTRAISLLLHADAHLRSILSQRIHDQPKQQALRIRSLLGHWQHKLRIESERDPAGRVTVQPILEALGKVRKISEELEGDLRGLQLLVEDAYQRRSLGLKLHLEKLIREDLPALHPESPLKVQADLWALDALSPNLEQTEEGTRLAEAISYTVTQALLNIYNHAGANFATVRTVCTNSALEVYIIDDGRGFDVHTISPEKTSLFKAQLKAREAGGTLTIKSIPRPQADHGTTIILYVPLPRNENTFIPRPPLESRAQRAGSTK